MKEEFYQRDQSVFDEVFEKQEESKEIALLQENEIVKRPLIVSDINPYFTPFYDTKIASPEEFLSADGRIALFSFHKAWSIETLKTYSAVFDETLKDESFLLKLF
jgi:hypothetical protein